MKKKILLLLAVSLFAKAYAQNSPATGITPTDNFTYNGYTVSHYGLGWYNDPYYPPPTAYFSAFGGFKFFTQGQPQAMLDYNGRLSVGTITPLFKFHIAQDLSMVDDIDVAQMAITGASDPAKRMVFGYDVNGTGFGFIKAGWYGHQWTNLVLQPGGGHVGVGTGGHAPEGVLEVGAPLNGRETATLQKWDWNSDPGAGSWGLKMNMYHSGSSIDYQFIQRAANADYNVLTFKNGKVGVGTTTPAENLDVNGNASISGYTYSMNLPAYRISDPYTNGTGWLQGYNAAVSSSTPNTLYTAASSAAKYGGDGIHWYANDNQAAGTALTERMTLDLNGNVGIGIRPLSKLHVAYSGTSINPTNAFNGGLIIEANGIDRTPNAGAQLEFVIPANGSGNGGPGSNPWGQGRIITVADNTASSNATGKMVFGTRRYFTKAGINSWNYGDDLVIDGAGNIGIGTLTPHEALSVNGTIRAKEIKVDINNWPDYVFKPDYQLLPIGQLKSYIDKNQHLPGVPSAAEVIADGQNIGEVNKILVKKVEELTLYLIDKDKEIKDLKQSQQAQIDELKSQLALLIKKAGQ